MPTDKQRGVLIGMALGFGATVAALCGAIAAAPDALLPNAGLMESWAHALAWDTLPVACLAISIGRLASHRFFTPADIDGGATSDGTSKARLLQAMLQNTLEQTVLAAVAWLGLAVSVPHAALAFIPAMAGLFVVGRATFWIGYLLAPTARAFGMVMTVVPTLAGYGWLLSHALGR